MKFVLYAGMGDQVLWLSALGALRRTGEAVRVICAPNAEPVARLFAQDYDDLTVRPDLPPNIQAEFAERRWSHIHTTLPILAWHGRFIGDELVHSNAQRDGMGRVIRDILSLKPDAPFSGPVWHDLTPLAANARMAAHGLPAGRTVIMAPWAHTTPTKMPISWWEDAAAWLRSRDLTPVTNVANRSRSYDHSRHGPVLATIPGTEAMDVPVDEIGPFAEACGWVFGINSGLTYLLARTRANMCVSWERDAADPMHERRMKAWSVGRVFGTDTFEPQPEVGKPFDPAVFERWLIDA